MSLDLHQSHVFLATHVTLTFFISLRRPASLQVGPNKCQPPSLTSPTRSAEPLKYEMKIKYANRIFCNSLSGILVRSRIRSRLLSHRLLLLILLLQGHLV